ncbi:MAG: PLP-dependent transferase [Saprospiraceae bacterium]
MPPTPVSPPIYLSSTYRRNADGSYNDGYSYARTDNPNRRQLEHSLARLESGAAAFAFGSGMAAVHAIFQGLQPGDHVLLPDDAYYNVYLLAERIFQRWGLEHSRVDMADPASVRAALRPNTKLVWAETPSNPQLKLTDIAALSEIAHAGGADLAVDNTWPTPVLTRPLELGADIVMHSTTKYFGGHSDLLGGCVILRETGEWAERMADTQHLGGGIPSPFDCWLVERGIHTLRLRILAQCRSAEQLAHLLDAHPAVERVNYPGLPSHPQHELVRRQMPDGYGGMLSVLVRGGEQAAMSVANRLRLFTTATSLGGVESLVEHRKSVEGTQSRTPDNLLRISVGIEDVQELIEDWRQALGCLM